MFGNFLKNREFFLKVVDDRENNIDIKIVRIIYNVNFYKEAKSLHTQLQPILATLNNVSRFNLFIFLNLYNPASNFNTVLTSEYFYSSINHYTCSLFFQLQCEKATILDACIVRSNLLENEVLEPYGTTLRHFVQVIIPAHKLAYVLNPKYMGSKLSGDQEEEVRNYLCCH